MEDNANPTPNITPASSIPTTPASPVMDVVPPATSRFANTAADPVEEEPNQSSTTATDQAEDSQKQPTVKKKEKKQQQPGPGEAKSHTTAPVAAIVMAIVVFIALTGLAYLAYSKG